MRLLVAEDDTKLLKSLKYILEKNKYTVDGVTDGAAALDFAATGEYDGLILDIMMPKLDGIEVLKTLRKNNISTPALFLTARGEVYQRVEGLDAGADDYLPKPFSTQELLARIRAMLRRKDNFTPDLLSFNGLVLNRSTYELCYGGNAQGLSGREFQILELLMQCAGYVVTAEKLMAHIWGWNSDADISALWVHISNLRKKISSVNAPFEIKFLRNAGYILEEIK